MQLITAADMDYIFRARRTVSCNTRVGQYVRLYGQSARLTCNTSRTECVKTETGDRGQHLALAGSAPSGPAPMDLDDAVSCSPDGASVGAVGGTAIAATDGNDGDDDPLSMMVPVGALARKRGPIWTAARKKALFDFIDATLAHD